jgi:gliding motility-associated-like protein
MKRILKTIFLMVFPPFLAFYTGGGAFLQAQQNLIQNPDFEANWLCLPVAPRIDTIRRTQHWTSSSIYDPQNTVNVLYPDSNNRCDYRWLPWNFLWTSDSSNTVRARSGRNAGYMTTTSDWVASTNNFNDFRYYMQTKLKQPLQKNEIYYIEFYIRRIDWFLTTWGAIATNGQGVAFSEVPTKYNDSNSGMSTFTQAGPVEVNGIILQNRDSVMRDTNFQKFSFCFQARGKEQYATFGNFLTYTNTTRVVIRPPSQDKYTHSDYIFDDVKLIPLRIGIPKDTAICEGDTVTIDVSRNLPVTRLWSDGSTDSIRKITKSGVYKLYTNYSSNQLGCVQEEEMKVTVVPKNIGTRAFDTVGCDNKLMTLKAGFGVPNEIVTWQDNSKSPTYKVNRANNYWARVMNFCVSYTDTFHVKYENCKIDIFAPNAFSPNGDNNNDVFKPYINQSRNVVITSYEFSMFDRWGNLVFMTKDLQEGWDGTVQSQAAAMGVYVWRIVAKIEVDGTEVERVFAGDVSLLK